MAGEIAGTARPMKYWAFSSTLLLSIGFSQLASALTPPEIPDNRNVNLYSPLQFSFGDSGESIFQAGGSVSNLAYTLNQSYIYSSAPTDTDHVGDLGKFTTDVLGTPSGILFWASHGGTNNVMVEVYPADDLGMAQSTAAVNSYTTGPLAFGSNSEIFYCYVVGSPRYNGVCVSPAYIGHILSEAQAEKSIIYAGSCDSSEAVSSLITTGYIRDMVGYENELYYTPNDGLHATSSLFGNMAGVNNDLGAYSNWAIAPLIPIAQNAMNTVYRDIFTSGAPPIMTLFPDYNPPNAGLMRLYNAPRLVYSDISQDTTGNGSFANSLYRHQSGRATV
jgi:hypothetical protein